MKPKTTLTLCFVFSCLLHLSALLCAQRYSLWFSSKPAIQSENWLSLIEKKEKDQILKTAFEPKEETKEAFTLAPQKERIDSETNSFSNSQIDFDIKYSVFFQLSLPPLEPLITSNILPTFYIPTQSFNLLDHLPKDLIIPEPERVEKQIFKPLLANPNVRLEMRPPDLNEMVSAPMIYQHKLTAELTEMPEPKRIASCISFPDLPKLPTLDELETASHSDAFDADVVFLPKEDQKGYIFALTLIPRPDLNLSPLHQRITFLIDKSNSIQQSRLNAAKSAVYKALDSLLSENSFNIIAFDSKLEKLSPNDLPCRGKSYAKAESFLDQIQLGSFFSTSDLYKPLFLTVPSKIDPDEIYTNILLTDGESLSKKGAKETLLDRWTTYNQGKVSLFVLMMNDLNSPTLEMATHLNRGKVIISPSHRGMKRRLLKLLKTIQSPIAKDISCYAISKQPQTKISLLTKPNQTPHLYLDQPFVILGETETLDDFILFVQGRLKDKWLNVKKTVSFLNAKKGNKSLKQEFALQKAYQQYEYYFSDENPKHIVDARDLLQNHQIEVPY